MKKTIFNENLLPIVQNILIELKSEKSIFLTSDVIKKQLGRYINDNFNPHNSFNANYGVFLKKNSTMLCIKEIRPNVTFRDDLGNLSKCSEWEFIN